MSLAGIAVFFQLNAIRIIALVFVGAVVPVLALSTFQSYANSHSRHLRIVEIPLELSIFSLGCQEPLQPRFT